MPTRPSPLYQMPGRPIAYFPEMVPACGSVKATVLLCQLVYWTPRAKDAEGWIYKSQLELMTETGLSRKEQRNAREELTSRGLLEERYDRLDHQLWLRVHVGAYNAAILLISDQVPKGDLGKAGKGISGSDERAHREAPNGDIAKSSEIPETTTENGGLLTHQRPEAETRRPRRPSCAGYPRKGEPPRWCDAHRITHFVSE